MKKIGIIIALAGIVLSQANQVFAGYFNATSVERCNVSVTSNLQRGSENDDVVRLQNLLVRGGYLNASPNGYFGIQTERAVRAFQRDNGISATGVVGETTRNAVNERLCDFDVLGNNHDSLHSNSYRYSSFSTFVTGEDPYVKVISAPITPIATVSTITDYSVTGTQVIAPTFSSAYSPSIPAVTSSDIVSTNIVYNPSMGYTYGIVPAAGSVTVTSPFVNSVYNEGDTVYVNWYETNLSVSTYTILLENTVSGQSRVVGSSQGNSLSFVLTKEVLDAVCSGSCNSGNQTSYKVVVSTPVRDIAGSISTLKAAIQPITIKRQFLYSGQVSITTSKSPVNSGEVFRLYTNIPRGASWDSYLAGNYSIKVKATCPSGVTVTIAGTSCGQEFIIPFAPAYFQQEIPATITNTTWYKQNVLFDLTVINLAGQVIGTSQVNVIANAAPFGW